ncbi:MAG: hypothetical protein J7L23_05005 [Candidatus Diapherotrites archaeon]|nr:hypothetical protein [Candidatus Diapherotrites archaeon]
MKKILSLVLPLLLLTGLVLAGGYKSALLSHPLDANTYPTVVRPGDTGVYVEIPITNYFSYSYENISTRLEVQTPFKGIKTQNFIRRIGPGERKSLFYKIDIDSNANPGEYLVNHYMNYSYTEYDDDGDPHTYNITVKKVIAITVSYSEDIEITSVGFDPIEIKPGDETLLKVSVKNTGSIPVRDVEVSYSGFSETSTTVSTAGAVSETKVNFVPLEATKKTISSIAPNETKTITFKMRSVKDTAVKAYQMPVTVSFDGGTLTDNAVINVIGKPDMRLAGFQSDKETIKQGQLFSLSVQLENVGTGSAKSVKAEILNGNATANLTGITTSYIGTIDPDDTGTAIFSLEDTNPGKHSVEVKVSFEDEYGNTMSKDYQVEYIITKVPPDYSAVIIAVLIVLGIIYFVYRRYKRKKELEELVK